MMYLVSSRRRSCWIALLILALGTRSALGQALDILSGRPLDPSKAAGALAPDAQSVVNVQAKLLPPVSGRPLTLSVTATIAPPWYTYSTTQKPVAATPTILTVDGSPDVRLTGEFRSNLPPTMKDEQGTVFETFADRVTWQAPLELRSGVDPRNVKVAGRARIQVCKTGTCLPPADFPFVAQLDPKDIVSDDVPPNVSFAPTTAHLEMRGRLEPRVAAPGDTVKLVISAAPKADWHVYDLADTDTDTLGYKPTLIVLTSTSGFRALTPTADRPVRVTPSAIPGDPPLRYHEKSVNWTIPILVPKNARPGVYPIEGLVGFQTCQVEKCDLPQAARFDGMLTVAETAGKASQPLGFAEASYAEVAKLAALRPVDSSATFLPPESEGDQLSSLPLIILASLLGGLILNFMPCVLPVIGLKILSFAEQAGKSRGHILTLNLWYSLGTLVVFWVLATLAAALNLGWGQQFQSTWFNVAMTALVFTMALSFLGVWEIPIPGFVGSGKATELAAREGPSGAFVKGAVTTILATPCSGPFLGPVFGYTLNQPPYVTYLVFTCIGLGMSAPYLAIGAFPQLIRFLPKPGAWMDTFKQIMGFAMLFTIVFLLSFMDRDYIVPTVCLMFGIWAGCWWIGRTPLYENLSHKLIAWGQGAAFAGLVGWIAFSWLVPRDSVIPWKGFSMAELSRLNETGHTVLVDFTADWCATCKANLYFAIETEDVRQAIEKNRIVPLLADYTDSDGSPEIKQMLESLHSNSIPLLAIFPADRKRPPIVLRDLVTKQMVLDAIQQAGPSPGPTKATAQIP